MASIKISELNEYTEVQDDDLFPIVDVANGETKKVKATNIGTGGKEIIMVGDENAPTKNTKLWIDTDEEGSGSASEVTNSLAGNETYLAPSVQAVNNKFNELATYSTEEKIIGTWTDGKPIYRRVIEGTVSKSGSGLIIGTIANMDKVINKYGQGLAAGLYWTDLDMYRSDTLNSIIQVDRNNGQIIAVFSSGFQNRAFHITIDYTKTTDTATNTVNTINDEPTSEESELLWQ